MEKKDNVVFVNLLDNMSDGIFTIGYDGKIRMENGTAAEILGFKEGKLTGKTIMDLLIENNKNDDFFQCIIDAVLRRKKISKVTAFYIDDKRKKYLRLVVTPLRDRADDIVAIVMFGDITRLVELGSRNEHLNKKLREFLDRFVTLMVDAIDERSHYNATHTRKMAGYAEKYLKWLELNGRGIGEEKKAPLLSSVWLHDVGKLVIPLDVMDKPDRLFHAKKDIDHKIEVGKLCEKLKGLENADYKEVAVAHIKKLDEAGKIVEEINKKGFITDEDRDKVKRIKKITCLNSDGERIPLLDDYAYEALMIERGTLTDEERQIIQSHVTHTYDMLVKMEFEGPFKDVPLWAGRHHELLDGSGYPNGLKGDEITWETRLLTIIDIYDALTAEDRPYKPPMSPEKAFAILDDMADKGKIDKEILEDFKKSRAWKNK